MISTVNILSRQYIAVAALLVSILVLLAGIFFFRSQSLKPKLIGNIPVVTQSQSPHYQIKITDPSQLQALLESRSVYKEGVLNPNSGLYEKISRVVITLVNDSPGNLETIIRENGTPVTISGATAQIEAGTLFLNIYLNPEDRYFQTVQSRSEELHSRLAFIIVSVTPRANSNYTEAEVLASGGISAINAIKLTENFGITGNQKDYPLSIVRKNRFQL